MVADDVSATISVVSISGIKILNFNFKGSLSYSKSSLSCWFLIGLSNLSQLAFFIVGILAVTVSWADDLHSLDSEKAHRGEGSKLVHLILWLLFIKFLVLQS